MDDWLKVIIIIVCSIASGILYRMGGSADYNTKFRDFGCPTVMLIAMWVLGWNNWLLLCWLLLFAALTTYWDDFAKYFDDMDTWCWILTGLGYSLAMLPYVIATGCWLGFLLRTVALVFSTITWSNLIDDVVWEESGRGALIIATLPLLTVG